MIKYKKGFKYQLIESASFDLAGKIPDSSCGSYIEIIEGVIFIRKGYAWDGPSGPAFDTKNFMIASLVHDALYQLMRSEKIPESCRSEADRLMKHFCIKYGMSRIRASYCTWGVKRFAKSAADPKNKRKVLCAP